MAETIREFLVSLGYSVDGGSETKFKNSVAAATKGAVALGLSLTAAATAVSAAVTKIAAGFDEMFYMSQRAGASGQNIKGLSYAVSQLGGSYQGALASIESFSQKLRSNPGYESLVKQLGVATRENGKLRETTAIVQDLSKALSSKPYYIQLQYMEALGLDERTYRALQSGDLTRYIEEYAAKARALGVDQKQAAEIGQQLTAAWRSLGATAELIGAKLEQTLGRSMASFVKDIDDFLIRNADKIVRFFEEAGKAAAWLAAAFQKLIEALTPAWEAFDHIAQSLTGQSGLQVAMEAFAVWLVGSWLLRVLGAFTAVGAGWGAMLLKLGINPLTLGVAGALALSTSPANGGEDQEIARRRAAGTWGKTMTGSGAGSAPQITDKRNWWQRTMPKFLGGKEEPKAGVQSSSATIPVEGRALLDTIASTEANSYNVMYGGKKFDSYADHPRENVPITSGPNAGRTSSAAGRYQFLASTWDEQAKKLGLKDFSPANQDIAAFDLAKTVYRQKTGRSLDADLKSSDPAVISRIGSALAGTWTSLPGGIEQGQNSGRFNSSFNRFLDKQAARALSPEQGSPFLGAISGLNAGALSNAQANAALIGGGAQPGGGAPLVPPANSNTTSVEMKQETNITVLGGSDPGATAAAVEGAQRGVNGGMLRNMQGAVR